MPFLTQRRWRVAGAVALAGCAALAVYGPNVEPRASRLIFAVYWTAFLVLLLLALSIALLDFRYIRMQYLDERRNLYRATLGEESFRRNLSESHRNRHEDPPDDR